jgi:hypothetical protein
MGLWSSDVANEGLLVWLKTYESVRFGGVELSEEEFLTTMKLVYVLLLQMKPLEPAENDGPSLSSSSSGVSSGSSINSKPESEGPRRYGVEEGINEGEMDGFPDFREREDTVSLNSVFDHGSFLESALTREERERRMRGGRLGEREGSVIYYDIDD